MLSVKAAQKAGEAILEVYYSKGFEIEVKADNSPLTIADKNAHDEIFKLLSDTGYPVLSEEGRIQPFEERKDWEYFWVVDPLDGTKEFIKHNGEFTVNIALIYKSKPILGVIYTPVTDDMYFGSEQTGAVKISNYKGNKAKSKSFEELKLRGKILPVLNPNKNFTIIASRSHINPQTNAFIEALKLKNQEISYLSKGSSLKFCLIAEGQANIYPRFSPTMEWDTAAGQAIVESAGGKVISTETHKPLAYNKEILKNPGFIVYSKV